MRVISCDTRITGEAINSYFDFRAILLAIVDHLRAQLLDKGGNLDRSQLRVSWHKDSQSLIFKLTGIKFEVGDRVSWGGRRFILLYRQFAQQNPTPCWMASELGVANPKPRYLIENTIEEEPR